MGKSTKEEGLIKVDNSFFSKIRKFWFGIFFKKKNKKKNNERKQEIEVRIEEKPTENISRTNKLFNYDAEDDIEDKVENIDISDVEGNIDKSVENSENIYKTVEVDNEGDDINTTYLFEKKVKSVYEEKEELERKLMNYYESIKNRI